MNKRIVRVLLGLAAIIAIAPVGAAVPHRAVPSLHQAGAKMVTVTLMRWPYT